MPRPDLPRDRPRFVAGPSHDPMNQKLRLLASLLSLGAWDAAADIFRRLGEAGVRHVAAWDTVVHKGLQELIWANVAALYSRELGFKGIAPASQRGAYI